MNQLSIKQEIVLNIIREHKEISQPDITKKMLEAGYYKTKDGKDNYKSAQSSVSKLLTQLKNKELVFIIRKERNLDAGGWDKNIWRKKE